MSMDSIRKMYGVPAKPGMRVVADGKPGRITRARRGTHHLWIRLDGETRSRLFHPTWRIEYPEGDT